MMAGRGQRAKALRHRRRGLRGGGGPFPRPFPLPSPRMQLLRTVPETHVSPEEARPAPSSAVSLCSQSPPLPLTRLQPSS